MNYALIGCGRVAPNHIVAAKANQLNIVAICDIDTKKAEEFRRDNQLDESVKIYSDYNQLFESEALDLIAIATWSGEHAKIALAAIRNKINVIIEKPIALSMEDAHRIVAESKEYNVKVCTSHQNRFNPTIKKIREAVEKKLVGNLVYGAAHVRWFRGENYYSQDDWRGTWAQDGGALMNQCIHNGDLLRWMMGDEIEEVFAYTDNMMHPYIEAEDLGMAVIKFKNGTYGLFEGTADVMPNGLEETLYVFGDQGTVKAGGMSVNRMEVWNVPGEEDRLEAVRKECDENPENVYGYGHTPLYRNMIEAITYDRQPLVDAEAGTRALELILAMYQSAAEKRPVKLPLEKGSTMDYIGRFDSEKK